MEKFLNKTIRYVSLMLISGTMIISSVSCTTGRTHHHGTRVPPGQAKKYTGERSAKRFAPGQQKEKKSRSHHDNHRKGKKTR